MSLFSYDPSDDVKNVSSEKVNDIANSIMWEAHRRVHGENSELNFNDDTRAEIRKLIKEQVKDWSFREREGILNMISHDTNTKITLAIRKLLNSKCYCLYCPKHESERVQTHYELYDTICDCKLGPNKEGSVLAINLDGVDVNY